VPSFPRAAADRGASSPESAASVLGSAALLYTLFVAYGCLVPLEFRAVPWSEAWARYQPIVAFHPGRFFRTDFVANVLLFLPLGFLWAAAARAGWRGTSAIGRSVEVWIGAVGFQALMEFLQIYTPRRSVSLWDVIAGGVGAAIGLAAWWIAGRRTTRALQQWNLIRGGEGVAGWLVVPYALFLVLWNVLPADLTLGPAALHAKWVRGMILPIPFSALGHDPVAAAGGLLSEALLWLPFAGLLVTSGRARPFVAWCVTTIFAIGIEGIQLLIQSRVSDTTDIVCAAAGAAAGGALGLWVRRRALGANGAIEVPSGAGEVWGALLATAAWTVVLLVGFLYPFDFKYVPSTIPARIQALLAVPFETYRLATEARAVSDLGLQLLLFAPIGAALAVAFAARRGRRAAIAGGFLATAYAAGVASVIEAAQVFLPSKVPDSTDIVTAAIGALGGYAAMRRLWRALGWVPREAASEGGRRPLAARTESAILAGVACAVFLAIGLLAARAPGVPYNVREPFARGGGLAILGVPVAAFLVLAPPMLLARWSAAGGWRRTALLPLGAAAHALLVWIAVRTGAPLESIHDVVGSPILGWPGDLEIMSRFLVLFLATSFAWTGGILLAGAGAATGRGREEETTANRRGLLRWTAAALPVFLLAHFVVVRLAATDNLTELMAGGGTIASSLCLGVAILASGAAAGAVALAIRGRMTPWRAAAIAGGALGVGWVFVELGTVHALEKYGRTFSALQFLLSPDREHYAGPEAILVRVVVAFAGFAVAGGLAQAPLANRDDRGS
jgi:VanZ family protein